MGKKVSPKAVVRNRIKRLMRAATQELLEKIKGGYDIIISANKDFSAITSNETKKELEILLKKEGLIK